MRAWKRFCAKRWKRAVYNLSFVQAFKYLSDCISISLETVR